MPSSNVEFVQSIYAAFGEGRVADILAACTSDVRWEVVGSPSDAPHYGVRHGHDGVMSFFVDLADYNEFSEFTPQVFMDAGDKIVVTGHAIGRLKSSGVMVEDHWIHVFEIRDDKLAAFTEWDNSAAHAAARRMSA